MVLICQSLTIDASRSGLWQVNKGICSLDQIPIYMKYSYTVYSSREALNRSRNDELIIADRSSTPSCRCSHKQLSKVLFIAVLNPFYDCQMVGAQVVQIAHFDRYLIRHRVWSENFCSITLIGEHQCQLLTLLQQVFPSFSLL